MNADINAIPLTAFPAKAADSRLMFPKHFANFIRQRCIRSGASTTVADLLGSLACLLQYAQDNGHVCLDLNQPPLFQDDDRFLPVTLPPLDVLMAQLRGAPDSCLAWNGDNGCAPLLLVEGESPRLYLPRYWKYERQLEQRIHDYLQIAKSVQPDHPVPAGLFSAEEESTRQFAAVRNALNLPFTVIAGGPGTGKTTVAVKVLAAKLLTAPATRIALAAPTGKAAARMKEAIESNISRLTLAPEVGKLIHALQASTIHRLLGSRFPSPYFKHDRANPLPYDFIVIDESSMIDLPLMTKLLDAMGPATSLLLIGDPYQLPSVEVGSIFGDMIRAKPVASVVTTLTQNFRAKDAHAIVELCGRINAGTQAADRVLDLLRDPVHRATLAWKPVRSAQSLDELVKLATSRFREIFALSDDPQEQLRATQSIRILTALRIGQFGVVALNRRIDQGLGDRHRLLILTENDPEVNRFNGDIGLQLNEPRPSVWFPDLRAPLSPLRIPAHEPAYAITGHRAQGSEFDQVHIVLPNDPTCPLLTREWLYTAVSRAKSSVTIWASEAALRKCLTTSVQRHSGLFATFP